MILNLVLLNWYQLYKLWYQWNTWIFRNGFRWISGWFVYEQFNHHSCSYIGALVMGIRDRHWDNQMIRKLDFKLFHIDYNLWESIIRCIRIRYHQIFSQNYEWYSKFVDLAIKTHPVLRENSKELIDFVTMAFAIYITKIVHKYISKKLRLKLNDEKLKHWLKRNCLKHHKIHKLH